MKYYENAIQLRLKAAHRYKAHQQIDSFIQERLSIKMPYSWTITPYPGIEHYSFVRIRSLFPMQIPGETLKECHITAGQLLMFQCNFCSEIRYFDGEKTKAKTGTIEEVELRLKKVALKNGFEIISLTFVEQSLYEIRKPNHPKFSLGEMVFSIMARVVDASLAEQALVNGLGTKRMFGFGFVSALELM
jgi:hypothetical protein